MKANAIKYIRANTTDGTNIEVQTSIRNYYINEQDGDQWELLEGENLLIIYKESGTEFVDIDSITSMSI